MQRKSLFINSSFQAELLYILSLKVKFLFPQLAACLLASCRVCGRTRHRWSWTWSQRDRCHCRQVTVPTDPMAFRVQQHPRPFHVPWASRITSVQRMWVSKLSLNIDYVYLRMSVRVCESYLCKCQLVSVLFTYVFAKNSSRLSRANSANNWHNARQLFIPYGRKAGRQGSCNAASQFVSHPLSGNM